MRSVLTRIFAIFSMVLALPACAADLTVGLATDVTSLDPHYHNLTPNNNVARHVYGYLVGINEKEAVSYTHLTLPTN